MYQENSIESIETEDETTANLETQIQDVSLSSIKTQDSIENTSVIINVDNEEFKDLEAEFRSSESKEVRRQMVPLISLKEAQQEVLSALAAPRIRLDIKPLHEICKQLHRIAEDFQVWKKQTDVKE